MSNYYLLPSLFGFTLIVVLLLAVRQYFRTQRAKRHNKPAVPGQSHEDTPPLAERRQQR